ncbi:hypothetical protein SAMN02799625_05059 [Methylobacterium sp. UNC300MFChir4.1]|nr:hypothetical protein SAMN02799636_05107 [Methylobacterium sp. 275MFSha3.1]SEP22195.1 hypothetical protein SAMN02799625_05059 [Methylobacterium sp. UNC300MFChir4.1]
MKNFSFSASSTNSDNSYVLRKMLRRGSEEAYYRYRLNDGERSFDFKRMFYHLEDIIDDFDSMLDDKDRVKVECRITIIRAIQICQDLFALDYAETVADYRNLMAYLTRDICPVWQRAMV